MKVGNLRRDKRIEELHASRLNNGENPPELFIIDSQGQASASKRQYIINNCADGLHNLEGR